MVLCAGIQNPNLLGSPSSALEPGSDVDPDQERAQYGWLLLTKAAYSLRHVRPSTLTLEDLVRQSRIKTHSVRVLH